MTRKRWFLPETPDVLGMLRRQMAVTIDGVDAFARWAGGDAAAAQAVRDAEHRGDVAKRDLLSALREAFVTPIEPEDLFALSRGIDRILNYATDLVEESARFEVIQEKPGSLLTLCVVSRCQINSLTNLEDPIASLLHGFWANREPFFVKKDFKEYVRKFLLCDEIRRARNYLFHLKVVFTSNSPACDIEPVTNWPLGHRFHLGSAQEFAALNPTDFSFDVTLYPSVCT